MPKGFSEKERVLIKQNLVEKGLELFSTYGLKKTNIEDLTNAVGIAKGSFYSFYESKEELFLDVLIHTEQKIIEKITFILKDMKNNPKNLLKEFIKFHINAPKENPIIRQVADKATRSLMVRKLGNNPNLKNALETYEYIPQLIRKWQQENLVIKDDPEILAGVLKAIFTIGLDDEIMEYIGRNRFPEIIEYLIEIITEYLVLEKE